MNKSVIIEEQYPYSQEEVWDALTDQSQLDEWLMHGTFQPRVGAEFELYWSGNDSSKGVTRGRVLEMVKPSKLSYTWNWGADDTVVTFFLEPSADGKIRQFQRFRLGDFTYEIRRCEVRTRLGSEFAPAKPSAGAVFLVVRFAIANETKKTVKGNSSEESRVARGHAEKRSARSEDESSGRVAQT